MKILFLSNAPTQSLDPLAVWFAGRKNEVIYATGRHRQNRRLPGARRVIINFNGHAWREEGDNQAEIWKTVLKNGRAGALALGELAKVWRPDFICCRSAQGAAFFIREVFPDAFIAAFATPPAPGGAGTVGAELDNRLFVQSQMRFARDADAVAAFPPILRPAIQAEPVFVDSGFFNKAAAEPFKCWKFGSRAPLLAISLIGLGAPDLDYWRKIGLSLLAADPGLRVVFLLSGGLARDFLATVPEAAGARLYAADFMERGDWRDLCASCRLMLFAKIADRRRPLEALACGCPCLLPPDPFLDPFPNVFPIPRTGIEASILELLAKPDKKLALAGADFVKSNFSQAEALNRFCGEIIAAWQSWKKGGASKNRAAPPNASIA